MSSIEAFVREKHSSFPLTPGENLRLKCTIVSLPLTDPRFVNNPELSDVQFLIDGRIFYAHKIMLVNASPRFRALLSSRFCDGSQNVIELSDVRYHIFEVSAQPLLASQQAANAVQNREHRFSGAVSCGNIQSVQPKWTELLPLPPSTRDA